MTDHAPQTEYNLYAYLLCHDIRLGTYVETSVNLTRPPTKEEAENLLRQVAETMIAKDGGEGCPYELRDITINPA